MGLIRFEDGTRAIYDALGGDRHLLHGVVDFWAAQKPESNAWINATRGTETTWAAFAQRSSAWAFALQQMGFTKGDFLATSLPLSDEHILLEYACFRLGVIHAPLDLRLSPAEVFRSLEVIRAKGYFYMAGPMDALGSAVQSRCAWIKTVQAVGLGWSLGESGSISETIRPEDPAQVIFTTGSTGTPKPALLSHQGITAQNLGLGLGFGFENERVLVNLPPSHVGCQSELLMTTFSVGATAVTLEIFDPGLSLDAIEGHEVSLVGQIPAMFAMEWRHSSYSQRDLSGLKRVVYGGQSVPRSFLEKMKTMAPVIGTGLGLTEASGFCTYVLSESVDEAAASIGCSMPLYPMTIRQPMDGGGAAGGELPTGEVGHVCFCGPQNFLGYWGNEEATRQALSTDGYLYTGDLGRVDAEGRLHFAGRAKWVIKPAGHQVFPGDVEEYIGRLEEKVASVGVIGAEHAIWSEAIVAFVEKRPGADLSETELRRHSRAMTSYMRPLHYVILDPGAMPLNRVAKVDALKLSEMAREEVRALRARGRWDQASASEDD